MGIIVTRIIILTFVTLHLIPHKPTSMKKTLIPILTMFFFFPFVTQAQIGGLLNKAKDKTEKKVEQKAEQKVEQKVDQTTSGSGSKSNSTSTSSGSSTTTSGSTGSGTSSSNSTQSTPTNTSSGSSSNTSSTQKAQEEEPKKVMSDERIAQLSEINKKNKRTRYYLPGASDNGFGKDACVADDGIQGDLHKANIEKIVFSTSKINPDGASSQLTTTFKTGDNIYMEVFLMTAVKNYVTYYASNPKQEGEHYNYIGSGYVHIFFDGREYVLDQMRFQGEQQSLTRFGQMLNGTGEGSEEVDKDIISSFKYLHKGEHKIRVEFWPQEKQFDDFISPDFPGAVGEFTFIQTEENDVFKPADGSNFTANEGIKTDLQKNNLGKILFSKTFIDPVTGTASQIDSVFHLGDNIFARAFMSTCMANYMCFHGDEFNPEKNDDGGFAVNVMIDDSLQPYLLERDALSGELVGKTTFNLNVISSGERAAMNSSSFVAALNNLPDGMHTVKIFVYGGNGFTMVTRDPVVLGSFKINKTPGSRVALGRNFNNVKAKMSNPALETQSVSKLNEKARAEGWKETFTKVKITEDNWIIERNDITGVIMGRKLEITALAKWPDGHCSTQEFSMWEDYTGSGYQSTMSVYGVGDQDDVDCN